MKKLITPALLSALIFILGSACNKEENAYLLTVSAVVNDSVPMNRALVEIRAPVQNSAVDKVLYTGENGKTEEVKFKNKVIVEISAGKGSVKGCDIVEVMPGPQVVIINMTSKTDPHNNCEVLE
ncbi:MAG TPA: hypothetical protein DCG19_11480 [Cryomorphaceae bacterium]|nr:hypothetical protein [Owenweeksia sp.]MBF97580.1 hypothetical protein [Owenweeksia sp.]HAD98019.1 hypothetical protein [Cryomorphaceae bacterium]HBF19845.1 hypothetical protein [Cryomorphaceae bacterium]|tara:strand:- start:1231 stop:1602 length:372 start_codon:yes stop_codon:yes gene_type:complete